MDLYLQGKADDLKKAKGGKSVFDRAGGASVVAGGRRR